MKFIIAPRIALLIALVTSIASAESSREILQRADSLYTEQEYELARFECEDLLRTLAPEMDHGISVGCLVILGKCLVTEGKWEDADSLFSVAMTLYQQFGLSDSTQLAAIHHFRGKSQLALNISDSALVNLELALSMKVGDSTVDPADKVTTMNLLTKCLNRLAMYDSALAIAGQAYTLLESKGVINHPALCENLYQSGFALRMVGRYEEAESNLIRSIETGESVSGAVCREICGPLWDLAELYLYHARYDESTDLFFRLMEIYSQLDGSTSPQVGSVLSILSFQYLYQAKYDLAEETALKAVSILEGAGKRWRGSLGDSYVALAGIYEMRGDFDRAQRLREECLSLMLDRHGPIHPVVANQYFNLSVHYMSRDLLPEAEDAMRKALDIWAQTIGADQLDYAAGLFKLAWIRQAKGYYAEALKLYERGMAIHEEKGMSIHPDFVAVFLDWANLHLVQGRPARAKAFILRAQELLDEFFGPDSWPYLSVQMALASVEENLGNGDVADSIYKACLANVRAESYFNAWPKSYALQRLGWSQFGRGNYEAAEDFFRQSLTLDEARHGVGSPSTVYTISSIAEACRAQGKLDEAQRQWEIALDLGRSKLGIHHPDFAGGLEGASRCLRQRGDCLRALELAGEAHNIRREHFQRNQFILSERDALTFGQQLRGSADNFLSCWYECNATSSIKDSTAINIIINTKGQVADTRSLQRMALASGQDKLVKLLVDSLAQVRTELVNMYVLDYEDNDLQEYQSKLNRQDSVANDIEARLSRLSPNFKDLTESHSLSVNALQNCMPENAVLVEYNKFWFRSLNPDTSYAVYLALVVENGGKGVIYDLGPASEVDGLIASYRGFLGQAIGPGNSISDDLDREFRLVSNQLYRVIWEPLESKLIDKHLTLVSPDGNLNLVAFAGLVDNRGDYLIEHNSLHYLSAGRDLLRLSQQSIASSGLFALGDPDFNYQSDPVSTSVSETDATSYVLRNIRSDCVELENLDLINLPGTREEIGLIVDAWKNSYREANHEYLGSTATEEAVKLRSPGSRVIHLSTHGFFIGEECRSEIRGQDGRAHQDVIGENPLLLSGLLLAGANRLADRPPNSSTEDGILTAYEVASMDLTGTEIVTLSACESAAGEVLDGEGVYGLRRAFQLAGARTVISSLWEVNDEVTAEFMGELYVDSEKTIPERLRYLQLKQLRKLRDSGQSDHPANWAAFIAVGGW